VLLAGSAAVFAGKPGRYYRQDMSLPLNSGLIDDWSKCIKTLSVSSREAWAHRLVDGSDKYWQSYGSQGKVNLMISAAYCAHINMYLCLVHCERKVHSYAVFMNISALDSVGYAARCVGSFPENNSGAI
jgi:hypothetical protein